MLPAGRVCFRTTILLTPRAITHCENSDVFPSGSVAVAVTAAPDGTGDWSIIWKLTSPEPSVFAFVVPMSISPSPLPEESQGVTPEFEKSSIRNGVSGLLLSVSDAVSPTTELMTGKFCCMLAPVSPSPESLRVTPLSMKLMRSMPRSSF